MEQIFSSTWVHLMFSTNSNEVLIPEDAEQRIYSYLVSQLTLFDCTIEAINGMPDHIHVLFKLNQPNRVNVIAHRIKEQSRFWINEQGFLDVNFNWQKGFGAFNVDEKDIESLANYIHKQKEVHQTVSFKDEYMSYLALNLL